MGAVHLGHGFSPCMQNQKPQKRKNPIEQLLVANICPPPPVPLCFSCPNQELIWTTGFRRQPRPPALTCTPSTSEQTCPPRRSNQKHITTSRSLRPLVAKRSPRWRWVGVEFQMDRCLLPLSGSVLFRIHFFGLADHPSLSSFTNRKCVTASDDE